WPGTVAAPRARERTSRRPSRTWRRCSAGAPKRPGTLGRLRLFGILAQSVSGGVVEEVGYAFLLRLGGRSCRPGGSHGALRGCGGHAGERLAGRLRGGREQ